ncbi:hypothetical protein ACFQ8W_07295 [Streptomyces sp. NPDC056508]|uniref:hypothetical protein n=1 Tax=Streptomyces sp. NPDC056508 TaxID=3345845 RepID=UPI003684D420
MSRAPDAPSARRPAPGTVAVVAPHGDDDGHLREYSRLGWDCVAVVLPDHERPAVHRDHVPDVPGYFATVAHNGTRHTVKRLAGRGVDLVVAGSGSGVGLADRLSRLLGLPGNDPCTTFVRTNRAIQAAALGDSGIASAASMYSTDVRDALRWTDMVRLPSYVVAAADSSVTARPVVCATPDEVAAAWRRVGRAALHQAGSGEVMVQQRVPGPQYLVQTISGPTPGEHLVSAVWAEIRTDARVHDRSELLDHRGPLFRALSLHALRVLPVLGIAHGAARLRVAWCERRGPVLLSARAFAQPSPADDYSPSVSHIAAAARAATTDGLGRASASRERAVMRVSLAAPADGCVLDAALLRTISTLPTLAHIIRFARPGSLLRKTLDRASSPGELVLTGAARAVEEDYRLIRSIERVGLYAGRCG